MIETIITVVSVLLVGWVLGDIHKRIRRIEAVNLEHIKVIASMVQVATSDIPRQRGERK